MRTSIMAHPMSIWSSLLVLSLILLSGCSGSGEDSTTTVATSPDADSAPAQATVTEDAAGSEPTAAPASPSEEAPTESVATATETGGSLEDTDLSIGVLPIADYAAVLWAEDQGFFEEEGLTVDLQTLQGGPVSIQRVVAGELDFGFTNLLSFGIAVDGGAPIKVAALTSSLGADAGGIFVPQDSDIQTMADLDGRTVGVNTTSNVGDVTLNALLEAEGVDASPVYVEVPFPEMVAGVEAGSIDAGYMTEPFTSAARAADLRNIVDLYSGPNDELPMAIFATSTQYAEDNPNTVAAFGRAVNAASADMSENTDAFREFLPGATSTPQEIANEMALPVFEDSLDVEKMQRTADLLIEQGLVSETLDMSQHVAS